MFATVHRRMNPGQHAKKSTSYEIMSPVGERMLLLNGFLLIGGET